jgi:hypothetical protein
MLLQLRIIHNAAIHVLLVESRSVVDRVCNRDDWYSAGLAILLKVLHRKLVVATCFEDEQVRQAGESVLEQVNNFAPIHLAINNHSQ